MEAPRGEEPSISYPKKNHSSKKRIEWLTAQEESFVRLTDPTFRDSFDSSTNGVRTSGATPAPTKSKKSIHVFLKTSREKCATTRGCQWWTRNQERRQKKKHATKCLIVLLKFARKNEWITSPPRTRKQRDTTRRGNTFSVNKDQPLLFIKAIQSGDAFCVFACAPRACVMPKC